MKDETQFTVWDEQIEILSRYIDLQKIINEELENRDMFIVDGISGIYLLLSNLEKMNCKFDYDKKLFMQKIKNSSVWDEKNLEAERLGLINGLCGLLWVYYLLEKEIK